MKKPILLLALILGLTCSVSFITSCEKKESTHMDKCEELKKEKPMKKLEEEKDTHMEKQHEYK